MVQTFQSSVTLIHYIDSFRLGIYLSAIRCERDFDPLLLNWRGRRPLEVDAGGVHWPAGRNPSPMSCRLFLTGSQTALAVARLVRRGIQQTWLA